MSCTVNDCIDDRRVVGVCKKTFCCSGNCGKPFCAQHDGKHRISSAAPGTVCMECAPRLHKCKIRMIIILFSVLLICALTAIAIVVFEGLSDKGDEDFND